MKTTFADFLLSGLLISIILLSSLAFVLFGLSGQTKQFFSDYHVIVDFMLFLLLYGLMSILILRLMLKLKPILPGTYLMNDPLFTYWKLYTVIYEFGKGALLPFTTIFAKPLVAKLFGARIGKDIALGGTLVDPQLIEIGEGAIIGQDSIITAHTINSGSITLKPVRIGARATIGVNAVVMSGVTVGFGAIIAASSVLPPDTYVPPNELWGGIPAKKLKALNPGQ